MTMRLYLLQHGDAVPEATNRERPLSDKGRLDIKRLARFVGWSAFRAGRILHSGKLRARQSAVLLASEMGEGAAPEEMAGLNPGDPVEPVAAQAAAWQENTLLVAHMPFLGRLAGLLLCGDPERPLAAFQPGSMLCLERDDSGRWSIAWMLRPDLLQG
jgi:phosphohistidine phosphatase